MQKGDEITQFKLPIWIRNFAFHRENKKSRIQEGIFLSPKPSRLRILFNANTYKSLLNKGILK